MTLGKTISHMHIHSSHRTETITKRTITMNSTLVILAHPPVRSFRPIPFHPVAPAALLAYTPTIYSESVLAFYACPRFAPLFVGYSLFSLPPIQSVLLAAYTATGWVYFTATSCAEEPFSISQPCHPASHDSSSLALALPESHSTESTSGSRPRHPPHSPRARVPHAAHASTCTSLFFNTSGCPLTRCHTSNTSSTTVSKWLVASYVLVMYTWSSDPGAVGA